MKLSYLLTGCIFVMSSAFFIKDEFVNLEIQHEGNLVDMRIVDIPGSCIGTRAKWFMKVEYNNKIFSKQIPTGFCEDHKVGDIIPLKYLEGKERVLFPEEKSTFEFVAIAILGLFGLYVIYLGKKKT